MYRIIAVLLLEEEKKMNKKEQIDLILRRTVEVHNKDTLIEKLNSGKKLVIKLVSLNT